MLKKKRQFSIYKTCFDIRMSSSVANELFNGCTFEFMLRYVAKLRAREHLLSDKSSHVYRHLQSSRACHDSCNTECFTILDSAASKFQIKIKEALHINRDRVNAEIVHFYANKIQKMHHRNFNASQDARH